MEIYRILDRGENNGNKHEYKWKSKFDCVLADTIEVGLNKDETVKKFNFDNQITRLDKKCSAIDKAISNKEKLIEKLTEYKKV